MAALNVYNFFNGDGLGGGFPTSRGADTLDELIRQSAKLNGFQCWEPPIRSKRPPWSIEHSEG